MFLPLGMRTGLWMGRFNWRGLIHPEWIKVPIPANILQAPWPPGMHQSWAGKKGGPVTWIISRRILIFSMDLTTPQQGGSGSSNVFLQRTGGSSCCSPQKPRIQQGHTCDCLAWPKKVRDSPLIFPTRAKVTDDECKAPSQQVMHFLKEHHYWRQMVLSPLSQSRQELSHTPLVTMTSRKL